MNKTAKKVIRILAKVFLIIESVIRVLAIAPVIFAFFTFKTIDDDSKECKNKKLVWAIIMFVTFVLIPVPFPSNISGILLLINAIVGMVEHKKAEEAFEPKPLPEEE